MARGSRLEEVCHDQTVLPTRLCREVQSWACVLIILPLAILRKLALDWHQDLMIPCDYQGTCLIWPTAKDWSPFLQGTRWGQI